MDSENFEKYVVIFCKKDDKGKFITKNFPNRPPYGCHHIVGVYPKVFHRLVAMIYAETSEADVSSIARILAGDLPVEVDSDFYLKF
jgi:hypothetical protein